LLAETLMRAGVVVEGNVFLENTTQMTSIDDNQPVQTFLTNGTNPPFSNGVSLWCLITVSG
jgi:hypothetical protein